MYSKPEAQTWLGWLDGTKNVSQMVIFGDDGNGGALRALPASLMFALKFNGEVDVVTGDDDDDDDDDDVDAGG